MSSSVLKTAKPYLQAAIRYLSVRDRSVFEVENYLNKRINDAAKADIILQIIKYLTEHNLVNDQKFASAWALVKLHKRYGPRKIQQDLLVRGIDKSIIHTVLQSIPEAAWLAAASEMLEGKGHRWRTLSQFECMGKAAVYLTSRGFNSNQTRVAVDQWYQKAVK